MTQFPYDDLSYQEIEPFLEATVNDPLPAGLTEPEWLEMPELEPEWLEMPELEPEWLTMPEIELEWLQMIMPEEPEFSLDAPDIAHDLDLDH